MQSKDNKFLIVKSNVMLNDKLDAVIYKLDDAFKEKNHVAYVTSGIRTAGEQLQIIKDYLTRKNIPDEFIEKAEVATKVSYAGEDIYSWQLGWSKLLNAGVIINPPLKAKLLLDYVNKAGVNRKGDFFNPSVHFSGKAFDIGGGANTVEDERLIVEEAMKSGQYPEIRNITVERQNNCLHTDVI